MMWLMFGQPIGIALGLIYVRLTRDARAARAAHK